MRRKLDRALQRRDRFGGLAAFEQRLALQLVEIRIVRLGRDQRVDLDDGGAQVGMPVGRDRARVFRRQALVVDRIAARDRVAALHEAVELGAHQVVAKLKLRRILLVPVRARLGELLERAHALGRHRMRLHVGIGIARGKQDFVGHALEGVVHALGRLAGGGEELDAGAVGRFLLLAHVGQQRAADGFLRPEDRRGRIAGIAARRDHRADAEQHGDDRLRLRHRELLAELRQVAAGNMTGLVRQHADDLVRRLGVHQRAGVHEDAAAVHDEGVERLVVDQRDLDVLLREPRDLQDRLRVVPHQLLDLGVADQRNAARQARRLRGNRRRNRQEAGTAATANAVNSASARVAGVRRRALIGLPSTVIFVRDREPKCSAKLVAPPGRVNATRITSGCAFCPASGRKDRPNAAAWRQSVNAPSWSGGAAGHDAGFRAPVDRAVQPKRRAGLHGDGRDGGGRPHRGGGRARHSHGGRAARGRRACAGDRGGAGGARFRAAGLHRVARHSFAAGADRAALFGCLPPRRGGRSRDRDDRIVGGIHSGVSVDVRAGRPGGDRQSGLSAVPAYSHRARLRAGADRDERSDALRHHRRESARGASQEAACRRAGGEPGQSDRHHDERRRRSPT